MFVPSSTFLCQPHPRYTGDGDNVGNVKPGLKFYVLVRVSNYLFICLQKNKHKFTVLIGTKSLTIPIANFKPNQPKSVQWFKLEKVTDKQ